MNAFGTGFEKLEGSSLVGARAWLGRNMILCPLCKGAPSWELATRTVLSARRYYFRCRGCQAVFSAPAAMVIPLQMPVNVMVKPVIGLVRIESVGSSESAAGLAGKELGVGQLQLLMH